MLQLGILIDENSVDSVIIAHVFINIKLKLLMMMAWSLASPSKANCLYESRIISNHQTDLISSSIVVNTSTPRLPSAVAIPTARAPTWRILLYPSPLYTPPTPIISK